MTLIIPIYAFHVNALGVMIVKEIPILLDTHITIILVSSSSCLLSGLYSNDGVGKRKVSIYPDYSYIQDRVKNMIIQDS